MFSKTTIKRFFQDHIKLFSALGVALGVILTILGYSYLFLDENNSLGKFTNESGDYIMWFLVIGPLLLIACLFYLIATIINLKKFEKLINTHSKSKFIKNLDEIEKLAWKLTKKERQKVENMRRKFRV